MPSRTDLQNKNQSGVPLSCWRHGRSRNAFYALSSLLPGTLPTGTDENGALLVHCLDVGQPIAANLAAEETLFIRALGHD